MQPETASELEEAVCSLSPMEQEVIRSFYQEGLKLAEISAMTGAPVSTVKSRLFTARHHLRSYFANSNEEEELP